MKMSRRRLLGCLPAVALLAASPLAQAGATVDVRDFGAVGDGVTDDSAAIRNAAAALRSGKTLWFPKGSYRFAEQYPQSGAAVAVNGLSDFAVDFEPGAELLMDNIDPEQGVGTSHAILITGASSRIMLRNITIRWAKQKSRSHGDGIRILGFPGDAGSKPPDWTGSKGTVHGVRIVNCSIESSPQAGVIFIGASDINVSKLVVKNTQGDGLHFHACRKGVIDNYTAINTGDDGLALVSYYTDGFSYDPTSDNFAFSNLGNWSIADFDITNVTVRGGHANGVRLAGANGVSITGLNISGVHTGAGVICDSSAPGVDTGWHYVAARGIELKQVDIENCDTGLQLLARPNTATDSRFTDFDVHVSDAVIRDCDNWSVRMESLTDQRTTGLRLDSATVVAQSDRDGKGGVSLENTHNVSIGNLSIQHTLPVVMFYANNSSSLELGTIHMTVTDSAQPRDASTPGLNIQNSTYTIGAIDVDRPGSPPDWTPIRLAKETATCNIGAAGSPATLGTVAVRPASIQRWITSC
ncbi:glycosyl hydrolase family 28-related protein [Mycolicibacterium sphagni]|uniref:glycosyl hydrolase family 28-related protein n=1 Tax=Mycolicibacterium sphagni TaxID=1786 RepID=UPI0021F295BF|nr:glycosyl hydrolase family 28-related protein [Mycolicibacterium sphagni]MCV7177141.1 right-handed parallel beta-helix repeat-containing protein [Mycolicibacterium sphagni]